MTTTANRPPLAWILLLPLLLPIVACVTKTSANDRESFATAMKRQPSRTSEAAQPSEAARGTQGQPPPAPAAEAAPEPPPVARPTPRAPAGTSPDTRVMLYQPKGDLLLVLINENHTGRNTEEGRVALSLGDPNRAYKILTDAQMTALLQSLDAAGYEANAAEFVPEDAQYLTAASADLPRYQGVISIERGGMKTKLLGFRRSSEGDALGLRRYEAYAKMKGLVQKWFSDSSRSEFPVGGVSIPAKAPK